LPFMVANIQTWATITINNKTWSKRSRLKYFAKRHTTYTCLWISKIYPKSQRLCKDY
jgi:hypothetical protein